MALASLSTLRGLTFSCFPRYLYLPEHRKAHSAGAISMYG